MKHSECNRTSGASRVSGRADDDGEVLGAAVFGAERNDNSIGGGIERHGGLGDLPQSGGGGDAIRQHVRALDGEQAETGDRFRRAGAGRGGQHGGQQPRQLHQRQRLIRSRRNGNRFGGNRQGLILGGVGQAAQRFRRQQRGGQAQGDRRAGLFDGPVQHRGGPCRRQQKKRRLMGQRADLGKRSRPGSFSRQQNQRRRAEQQHRGAAAQFGCRTMHRAQPRDRQPGDGWSRRWRLDGGDFGGHSFRSR